jgi:hypothetical protein
MVSRILAASAYFQPLYERCVAYRQHKSLLMLLQTSRLRYDIHVAGRYRNHPVDVSKL